MDNLGPRGGDETSQEGDPLSEVSGDTCTGELIMGTKIEWTDETWNPVTGCTKVSPGCANCYAERMSHRLRGMHSEKYQQPFETVTIHPKTLTEPDHWRRPRMVFVCSMGDLFHRDVPTGFIDDVLAVADRNPQHTFQILTKRADRLQMFDRWKDPGRFPPNVWIGVSVESDEYVSRVEVLSEIHAVVRFVSVEPMLGPVPSLIPHLDHLEWVIVGGETGPGARPTCHADVVEIRDACVERGIPFFFKKWGDASPTPGRILGGRTWDQIPGGGPCGRDTEVDGQDQC